MTSLMKKILLKAIETNNQELLQKANQLRKRVSEALNEEITKDNIETFIERVDKLTKEKHNRLKHIQRKYERKQVKQQTKRILQKDK